MALLGTPGQVLMPWALPPLTPITVLPPSPVLPSTHALPSHTDLSRGPELQVCSGPRAFALALTAGWNALLPEIHTLAPSSLPGLSLHALS